MGKKTIHTRRFLIISLMFAMQFTISKALFAQERSEQYSKHAIYAEIFGQGVLYSLNYDHRINQHYSMRVGFSHWSVTPWFFIMTGKFKFTAFPIMLNRLSGQDKHHLELGIGLMPTVVELDKVTDFFGKETSGRATRLLGTATLGYRLQPLDSGILFRAGITPLFTLDAVAPMFGISFGYTF